MESNSPTDRVAAFDLGTRTGVALWTGTERVLTAWELRDSSYEGGGMRFLRFERHVRALLPLRRVFYEEVRSHMLRIPDGRGGIRQVEAVEQAHAYGGFLAILLKLAEEHGIPTSGLNVGKIKKHATGIGNASKRQMVDAANARLGAGLLVKQQDEADAAWILDVGLIEEGVLEPTTRGRYTTPPACAPAGKKKKKTKLPAPLISPGAKLNVDEGELASILRSLKAG